jgi:hypothetical protein
MARPLTSISSAYLQIGVGKPQRFPIEKMFVALTRVPERLDDVTQDVTGRGGERGLALLSVSVPLQKPLPESLLVVVGDPGSPT